MFKLISDEEITTLFNELYPKVSPFPVSNIPESYKHIARASQKDTLRQVAELLKDKELAGQSPTWTGTELTWFYKSDIESLFKEAANER